MNLLWGALLVGIGGALGSVLRWGIADLWRAHLAATHRPIARSGTDVAREMVPWPTLSANVLACFLLGVLVVRLGALTGAVEQGSYLLAAVGFCGGLSTASTVMMDVISMVRRGIPVMATGYLLLTIGSSMGALWAGVVIAS